MQTPESIESIIGPRERSRDLPEQRSAEKAPEREAVSAKPVVEKPDETERERQTPAVEATGVSARGADEDGDIEPGESGLKKALKAERKLRREARKQAQELQRQIDYFTGQMAAQRAAPPQAEQAKQPVKDDAAAKDFDEFLSQGPAYVQRIAEAKAREPYVRFMQTNIKREQRMFEAQHKDAAPAIGKFFEHAKRDPQLSARFTAIADGDDAEFASPVEFAYQWGRAYQQAAEVGDLATYKERVRAELLAEMNEQAAGSAEAEPAQAPKTLAGARGSGGAGASARSSGPVPLEDIIGPRKTARR